MIGQTVNRQLTTGNRQPPEGMLYSISAAEYKGEVTVPSKIRPSDWDYYFSQNAPQRGGPLRALSNILISALVLALLGFGGRFAFNSYSAQQARLRQTAIARGTAEAVAFTTRTAITQSTREARTAVALAQTATAGTVAPTAAGGIGQGSVIAGGNLRSEPRISNDTVVGLIWPGDQITFLEQQSTTSGVWYRIRVTQEATNRGGQGVAAGTEGWANSTLLSPPGQ